MWSGALRQSQPQLLLSRVRVRAGSERAFCKHCSAVRQLPSNAQAVSLQLADWHQVVGCSVVSKRRQEVSAFPARQRGLMW